MSRSAIFSPVVRYLCPRCSAPLEPEGESLCCRDDGYRNIPEDGIRDFLTPDESHRHESFLAEYIRIRTSERRGSGDPLYYLSLPDVKPGDPFRKEWSVREESLRWLHRQLHGSREQGPLRVLDAGAGNCWLTRWLAEWGHAAVALDLNTDPLDGLGAGAHYLSVLPLFFDRVRADFAHLPFVAGSFDLVLFNASFHYAEDRSALLAEALRVLRPGGRIMLIDSPIYRREESGRKMLAERAGPNRSGFLTIDGIEALAREHALTAEIDLPKLPFHRRLRRRMLEQRLGREVAVMGRVVMG